MYLRPRQVVRVVDDWINGHQPTSQLFRLKAVNGPTEHHPRRHDTQSLLCLGTGMGDLQSYLRIEVRGLALISARVVRYCEKERQKTHPIQIDQWVSQNLCCSLVPSWSGLRCVCILDEVKVAEVSVASPQPWARKLTDPKSQECMGRVIEVQYHPRLSFGVFGICYWVTNDLNRTRKQCRQDDKRNPTNVFKEDLQNTTSLLIDNSLVTVPS